MDLYSAVIAYVSVKGGYNKYSAPGFGPSRRHSTRAKAHTGWKLSLLTIWLVGLGYSQFIFATSIVVIVVPDRVVIAADSKGTFAGGGKPTTERQVCKIYRVGDTVFGVAGFVNDPVTQFSVPAETIRASRRRKSISEKIEAVHFTLEPMLEKEALLLMRDRPEEYRRFADPQNGGTTIIFIGVEKGVPIASGINFALSESQPNAVHFKEQRDACPGNCPKGIKIYWAGSHTAIERFVAHGGEISNPEKLARFLVQLEIDDDSPNVGGPINVLSIDKSGLHQADPKENCPTD